MNDKPSKWLKRRAANLGDQNPDRDGVECNIKAIWDYLDAQHEEQEREMKQAADALEAWKVAFTPPAPEA